MESHLHSEDRRAQHGDLVERIQSVTGELPSEARRVSLDVKIREQRFEDDLIFKLLSFATEPDDRCTAWLIEPGKGQAKSGDGVLALHQTTHIGKDEPAGFGGNPNLHYGRELARRGCVVLCPDFPGFGENRTDPYQLGYASATMKGIWNHLRAIDLLHQAAGVDPCKIHCVGHSLGGHNALLLAVFARSIRTVVSSCGFVPFAWNDNEGRGDLGDLTDWSHAGYMPRIAERYGCRAENMPFDFPEILRDLADRRVFINAPQNDFMNVRGVRECLDEIRGLFRDGHLEACHPDCAHDFPPEVRELAWEFLLNSSHT